VPLAVKIFLKTEATEENSDKKPAAKKQRTDGASGMPAGRAMVRTTTPARTNDRFTQEEIDELKTKGLIKWNGERGHIPQPVDILELNGASGLTKLCMTFICRKKFCLYGDTCRLKHVRSWRDLTAENKTKLKAWVNTHVEFALVTPNGTN
jgi:hypothetical protein